MFVFVFGCGFVLVFVFGLVFGLQFDTCVRVRVRDFLRFVLFGGAFGGKARSCSDNAVRV